MFRFKTFLTLIGTIVILVTGVSSAFAQNVTPRHSDPGWQALYWNNTSLSGAPIVQRYDNDLNFDWGYGSPDAALPADQFSARWSRYIDVTPDTYRFTVVSDDGMRLWVDGVLLIDSWSDHPAQSNSAKLYLGSGHHLLQVEYYENGGTAVAKVSYQLASQPPTPTPTPIPPTTDGWTAEYFNNTTLSGYPMISQIDANIDFNWGFGSPNFRFLPADYFSVRWTRNMNLPAGNYRFTMTADDGARLFVNGHTLIDAWRVQPERDYTGDIYLPGGAVTVQMEYFEQTEVATARLRWQKLDQNGERWSHFRADGMNVEFDYPTHWQLQGSEVYIFRGSDGAMVLNPAGGSSLDDFVVSQINHRLRPFGDDPDVEALTIDGQPARLIIPGGAQVPLERNAMIVVIYPKPITFAGGSYSLLTVTISESYARHVAQSLRFLDKQTGGDGAGTVIVDDRDPGFTKGGLIRGWSYVNEGYGNSLTWTNNNDWARPQYNWGRWYPQLRAGRYEVFVYIPDRYTTSSSVTYWISHQGGFSKRIVNQNNYSNQWISLGTYTFRGTRQDYLSLADVTGEPYLSRIIAWDAAKWEPR